MPQSREFKDIKYHILNSQLVNLDQPDQTREGFHLMDLILVSLNLFKVGHSISGCIEAPMQMVMVLYLILKEYLPIPFQDDPRYVDFKDR